jgi:hypothetical protein
MEKARLFTAQNYPPVTFHNIEFGQAEAALSYDKSRIVINGRLSLNIADTAKFGKQFQVQVYSDQYKIEERSVKEVKWHRSEVFFSFQDLEKAVEVLCKVGDLKKPQDPQALSDDKIIEYIGSRLVQDDKMKLLAALNKLLHQHGFGIW